MGTWGIRFLGSIIGVDGGGGRGSTGGALNTFMNDGFNGSIDSSTVMLELLPSGVVTQILGHIMPE